MKEGFETEIHELNNNSLKLDNIEPQPWLGEATEQQCHDQKGTGRGILCITPGASRASGFVISWDDDQDPNRRFKIRFRDDQWVDEGADNVKITRCCDSDGLIMCNTNLNTPQANPVPPECAIADPSVIDGESPGRSR